MSTVWRYVIVSLSDYLELVNKSQKGGSFGFGMGCKQLIISVIKLVREDWLHWLTGFTGIPCLQLPTCADEMGWGTRITAQDILFST